MLCVILLIFLQELEQPLIPFRIFRRLLEEGNVTFLICCDTLDTKSNTFLLVLQHQLSALPVVNMRSLQTVCKLFQILSDDSENTHLNLKGIVG
jgi:hypothetical protein